VLELLQPPLQPRHLQPGRAGSHGVGDARQLCQSNKREPREEAKKGKEVLLPSIRGAACGAATESRQPSTQTQHRRLSLPACSGQSSCWTELHLL
jgi:hypothetical protein